METKYHKVVMIPWLSHGHISPYLELAKKLSMNNFSVYFCSTPVILDSIKPRLEEKQVEGSYRYLNLVEINLPSSPVLPAENHKISGLKLHLVQLLVKIFLDSAPSVIKSVLESVKPDLIIFDIYQPWLPSIASSLGIPAVHFWTAGVAASAYFYHITRRPDLVYPFAGICLTEAEITDAEDRNVPQPPGSSSNGDLILNSLDGSSEIVLMKYCDEMERDYMKYISDLSKKRVVSVGPLLVNDHIYVDDDDDIEKEWEVLEWLDKKEESSTVFVCFGSESFLCKEEMEELTYGLVGSNVNFVWVIRALPGEKTNKVEEIFDEAFLESLKEKGKFVLGWVSQRQILKHKSIGGFLNHCGWSSVMESLRFGVPIIAMPIQYDQPINARMLVDIGVAVEVVRGENGVATEEEVAKKIKEVVAVAKGGGEVIRKKAREMGEKVKAKGNWEVTDNLVVELKKLCKKENENKANEMGNVRNEE